MTGYEVLAVLEKERTRMHEMRRMFLLLDKWKGVFGDEKWHGEKRGMRGAEGVPGQLHTMSYVTHPQVMCSVFHLDGICTGYGEEQALRDYEANLCWDECCMKTEEE